MSGAPQGYIEVSERIAKFYEDYPEGSLRCKEIRVESVGADTFLIYVAQAYRTQDDQAPAEGAAWEPVPGKTNFTRDSELMNAETSAWGRAIAALGFEVHRGIASANEVRARSGDQDGPATEKQRKYLNGLLQDGGAEREEIIAYVAENCKGDSLTRAEASRLIETVKGDPTAAVAKWREGK